MPRTCSVCRSNGVSEIDREFDLRTAIPKHSVRYSMSAAAVLRHKQAHLPQKLALAKQGQETLSAESLLAEMADVKARLRRGMEQAEKAENASAFVAFAREHRQSLESYFAISERVAERTRAVSSGFSLAEVIAKARARVAMVDEEESCRSTEIRELGREGPVGVPLNRESDPRPV